MSFWSKLKHAAKKAAETVVDTGKTVVDTTVDAGKSATNTIADGTVTAWEATSNEAHAIGTAIESTGLTIGSGVLQGGQLADSWLEQGSEYAYDGLVKMGDYLNQQACDIALGSALGAVFAALEATPEQEAVFGSAVALCGFEAANAVAINTASSSIAAIIIEPIWKIPGVSKVGNKKLVEDLIAFVIFKCIKDDPQLVVSTGGQIFVGLIIAVITTLICEGSLPGGFKVWQGTYHP